MFLTWPQEEAAHSAQGCLLQLCVSTGRLDTWAQASLDTGTELPLAVRRWHVTRRVCRPPPQLRVQGDQDVTIHLGEKAEQVREQARAAVCRILSINWSLSIGPKTGNSGLAHLGHDPVTSGCLSLPQFSLETVQRMKTEKTATFS